MKQSWILISALLLTIALAGCDDDPFYFEDDFSTVPAPYDTTTAERIVKSNGLIIYIHSTGVGEFTLTERDRVLLYYTFRLKDGTIVQSSYSNGKFFPDEFSLATTVRGFREGLVGAKNGARRTLVIPPALGYGSSPNSPYQRDTLYYDVLIDTILE
jgi:FKBP-type peptidyl-prolyl cis-trans isomerase